MSDAILHLPIAKARSAMTARKLDTIGVSDASSIGWFAGRDDDGLELSNTILIAPKGTECLCKAPHKLMIKA